MAQYESEKEEMVLESMDSGFRHASGIDRRANRKEMISEAANEDRSAENT